MEKQFLGKGWHFPISPDGLGRIRMSEHEDDIREAIVIILGTAKGERPTRPDFGCGINDFTFEIVNSTVIGQIETTVRESLQQWEPRIEVLAVTVSTEAISKGKLHINIDYLVRSTNNRFNLVYPFYLTESS
jgi:uncharacterized protein